MADFEDTVTLQCVSNEVGGNLVGNATWQGVRLATLLDRAGVQAGATQIVGRSVDGFTAGFPTEVGLDGRTALVAVAMNGEPLPAEHGFPARLVVAGLYGYVSATKWLDAIELVPWEDFDGYWVPAGVVEGGSDQDGLAHRRAAQRRHRRRRPAGDRRRRVAADARHRQGRGAGRRRRRGRTATLGDVDERQHVGAVVPAVGRHVRASTASGCGRRTPPARRRPRSGADPAPDGATGWHTPHGARSAERVALTAPSIRAPCWRGARRGCATCRGGRSAIRGGSSSPRSCCSRPRCRG